MANFALFHELVNNALKHAFPGGRGEEGQDRLPVERTRLDAGDTRRLSRNALGNGQHDPWLGGSIIEALAEQHLPVSK
jgi:two-component sensor histidine kinase